MKHVVLLSLSVLLLGCFSTPSSTSNMRPSSSSAVRTSEPPRREFTPVEDIDPNAVVPFVVDEYLSDGRVYQEGSVKFATALLLSDMGILQTVDKELFHQYAAVIFTDLPAEDQVKQIVIPNLSQSNELDKEKNAYLFITKNYNQDGILYYLIESNIPISSYFRGPGYYNGYVMRMNSNFIKGEIPSSWVSIMYLYANENNLLYRGVAYPEKSDLLAVRSSTGNIGTDNMVSLRAGHSTVPGMKRSLERDVGDLLAVLEISNVPTESIEFFRKYVLLSLSAYSYINSNFDDAQNEYLISKGIDAPTPDNLMGRSFTELMAIMDYIIMFP